MSHRGPINFLSKTIPPDIRDRILSRLPGQHFAAIQEIVSTIPDEKLRPLVSS